MDPRTVRERLEELSGRAHDALPKELVPGTWRHSAVMILLWDDGGVVRLALARRSHALRTQPGTVALPGGVVDTGEDPADAARRETEEELGVAREAIALLGRLDEHWTIAQFTVAAFVGWHDGPPRFAPCADEVAEVLALDLDDLLDDARHDTYRVLLGDVLYEDDILHLGDDRLAGMTADILVDLRDWLRGTDRRRMGARVAALRAYLAA